MSVNGNQKKDALLGEPHGTAANRLRKMLLFKYVVLAGHGNCHRCGRPIESVEKLSVEHKTAWQSAPDPRSVFFDIDDIAFSHLTCNVVAGVSWNKRYSTREEWRQAKTRLQVESKKRLRAAGQYKW